VKAKNPRKLPRTGGPARKTAAANVIVLPRLPRLAGGGKKSAGQIQVEAEQQVKTALDYAEGVIHTARDPLVVLRADLRLNTANEAFYKTFKTTPAEAEGRLIFDLSGGAWRIPKLRLLLEDILPRNSFFNDFEVDHDFPQIGRRLMLLNARQLKANDNGQGMILLSIEDVTERQHADVTTSLLAAIVNSSDDAIVGKNLNGVITSWNKGAERLFGYTASEAVGRSVVMLIPPDRLAEEPEILARLKRGQRVDHFETVRLRKDGQPLDISLTISPIVNAFGGVVGASKIARDITERKRTEEFLRRSEERFRTLFDLGPVAVYSCNVSGMIQEFNRRAVQLWGREPAAGDTDERFCGSFKLFLPDGTFMPHAQCPMAEVLSGKVPETRDSEVVIERPDGSRVTVVVNIHALKDQHGQITGAINCFYDITERKQMEQAVRLAQTKLADRADQLEKAVTERTRELTATNSQLEAFVYSIAHDLRAPVRALQAFSELLVEEAGSALSETAQNYAKRINRSSQFMDALLSDLLAFSRIAQQNIELAPVNLDSVVQSALARLQPDIRERNARVEIGGPWPLVLGHESMVAQVLFNLAANALKFIAPERPPVVRLRTEDRGEFIRVWVEDNGIGISTEHRDQIFRLFTRLNGEQYPGTGLGLAIVQKGVERMNGTVGVESVPGQGSRFWFELRKA
jgi:PAS domain S-box-containing protein